jgi:hypothetical protein
MTDDELMGRLQTLHAHAVRVGAKEPTTGAIAALMVAQALATLAQQLQPIAEVAQQVKAKLAEDDAKTPGARHL